MGALNMLLDPSHALLLPSTRTAARALVLLAGLGASLSGCGDSGAATATAAMILPDSIGRWVRRDPPVTYDRETIFDYIDGAGEVYRSYAFGHVLVARYEGPGGEDLAVELFDMGNADDAYGVFSFAREQEEEGIGGGYERRGGVLCFWQDRYYVCVAAEQRPADNERVLEDVARGIAQRLPAATERPALVSALPSDGLVPSSERFFHIHQSLNYHYYLARDNVLHLSPETDAVLARYQPGPTYLLIVGYENEGEATDALASFRQQIVPRSVDTETAVTEGGKFVTSGQHGRFLVVVLDAPSESAATSLREATSERLSAG